MKYLFIALVVLCSSCSIISPAFEKIGVYVDENPVIINIGTRQGITRFIEKGNIQASKVRRAQAIRFRSGQILAFVDSTPEAQLDQILDFIKAFDDLDKLAPADRLLILDLIDLISSELIKSQGENINMSEKTKRALISVLETAISTSELYL